MLFERRGGQKELTNCHGFSSPIHYLFRTTTAMSSPAYLYPFMEPYDANKAIEALKVLEEYFTCSRQDADAILKPVREAMAIVGKRANEEFLIQAI
ncbi:Uncharacterized protein APZ42_033034 [Daphnia magna]|uniref:Uncharacterized protein n=1 Tax=Daphnia magna TaxID=35525 RepID=A0A164LFU4_9CRUS|nr:Uncharacterized protein APZ42_033034 [Daphnia magna]